MPTINLDLDLDQEIDDKASRTLLPSINSASSQSLNSVKAAPKIKMNTPFASIRNKKKMKKMEKHIANPLFSGIRTPIRSQE